MKAVQTNLPTAALVGRANVGKSTLFNRLTESHKALTSDTAGTTRDIKQASVLWRGETFELVDTGGLEFDHDQAFDAEIQSRALKAIEEVDIVLFVVDIRSGALEQDRMIASRLRLLNKPVYLVGNKADTKPLRTAAFDEEWYKLGLGPVHAVSAIRGNGLGDLLDLCFETFEKLGKETAAYSESETPRILFIGEPNVGKSSIVNQILGEERFITSPVAHTTREPIDTLVEFDDNEYIIVDTAGIRRKARVNMGLEKSGVRETLEALKRADIAVLVLDASKQIDQQEKRLAGLIHDAGVGCVIAVNKWDLVEDKSPTVTREMEKYVHAHMPFLSYAPVLTVSAKDRQRIHKLFPLFDTIMKERSRVIDDNALDKFLRQTIAKHKPARGKGVAHPTIFRLMQVAVRPPRFELIIKGRRTDVLHASYLRFLENRLRERFGFTGVPLKFFSIPSKKTRYR